MPRPILFRNITWLLIILSLLLLISNIIPHKIVAQPQYGHKWELFEPGLVQQIRSVDDLLKKADSIAISKNIDKSSLDYAVEVNRIVKKRFYHGYSYYSQKENWIANLMGKLVWKDLSAIVLPDDILKYPMAACSQQSIVLMECLKRRGITYRKVGFDHHYALEANIDNKWYFFDTDLEPDFTIVHRTDLASLLNNKEEFTIYKNRLDSSGIQWGLAHQFYGIPNAAPAPRAFFFQEVTKILSKTIFICPLLVLGYLKYRQRSAVRKMRSYSQAA